MPAGHPRPTKTRFRNRQLITHTGHHAIPTHEENDDYQLRKIIEEDNTERIVAQMTEKFEGFKKIGKTLTDNSRILLETNHGVQLRKMYHSSGAGIYYYLCLVTTEFEAHNLGAKHIPVYKKHLKTVMEKTYGEVYKQQTWRTSIRITEK